MTPRLSVALALLAALAAPPPDTRAELEKQRAALEKRLTGLLRERAAELGTELTARVKEYQSGQRLGALDLLLGAFRNLGQAERELTDDLKERAGAHERLIQRLREIEVLNKARRDAGRINDKEYRQTVAERARVECEQILDQMRAAGADKAKLAARLEELRRERLEALKIAIQSRMTEMMAGRGTLDILIEVLQDLAEVEIELASNPRQRRQAQERLLKALQELEQLYQKRFDAGRVGIEELCETRAARLEAEIALGGDQVPQLRQELVTNLRKEVEARMANYRAGRGVLDILMEAHRNLARAELALAGDVRQQVTTQERAVKALRDLEELNQGRFDAGHILVQELAQTKAARLAAEIELVRRQLKALGK
jgi:hypothetical protein